MSGVSDPRVLWFLGLFILSAVVLFALMGCSRADEPTPTPTPEPTTEALETLTPEVEPTEIATVDGPTPAPASVPTAMPEIAYEWCMVGMRLDPGQGCKYIEAEEINFSLAILPDGVAVLDGDIGPTDVTERNTPPGQKLCACQLRTESDGLSRIISALPSNDLGRFWSRPELPPSSSFLGECEPGMELVAGELCRYTATSCVFEVRQSGEGHFLGYTEENHLELNALPFGGRMFDFVASADGGTWTIQTVPEPEEADSIWLCQRSEEQARLISAVLHGNVEQLKELIEQGADVHTRNRSGSNLLEVASAAIDDGADAELFHILVEAGADVNAVDAIGRPLLLSALKLDRLDVVGLLLEAGADASVIDTNGRPALQEPIREGDKDLIAMLLAAGANPSAGDHKRNPLVWGAILGGELEIAQMLFEAGADPNMVDEDLRPLLESAIWEGPDMTRLILEAGAHVDIRVRTGAPIISATAQTRYLDAWKLLLAEGPDVEACDHAGNPPLVYAIRSGDSEIVRLLLDAGANADGHDSDGEPMLATALLRENEDAVRVLVDAGANVNAVDSQGSSILELAGRIGSQEIVQYLTDAGAE